MRPDSHTTLYCRMTLLLVGMGLSVCKAEYPYHDVYGCEANPTGDPIGGGKGYRNILAWDLATGEQVGSWYGHDAPIRALALSQDGTLLMSASMDSTLLVWQVRSP